METNCRRENPPPPTPPPSFPVLKSFTLPRVNHLISLPVSATVLTLLLAAPAAAPPCSNRLLRRSGFRDDSTRSRGFYRSRARRFPSLSLVLGNWRGAVDPLPPPLHAGGNKKAPSPTAKAKHGEMGAGITRLLNAPIQSMPKAPCLA